MDMKIDDMSTDTIEKYLEQRKEKAIEDSHKFKVGDIVRFKSEDSMNARYFDEGLTNLEIKGFEPSRNDFYYIWESDKSQYWGVEEDELELQPTTKVFKDSMRTIEVDCANKHITVSADLLQRKIFFQNSVPLLVEAINYYQENTDE